METIKEEKTKNQEEQGFVGKRFGAFFSSKAKVYDVKRKEVDKTDKEQKSEEGDVVSVVEVPVQSIYMDRDGDIVNDKGQDELISQFKTGLVPMFPNHGWGDSMNLYDFRDIMGKWVDGYKDDDGVTWAKAVLRKNNDYAEQLKDLIEQGMPVGFSIGFIVREAEEMNNGGFEISSLELLETSPVGIPSNRAGVFDSSKAVAMVKSAIKGSKTLFDVNKNMSLLGDYVKMEKEENKEKGVVEQGSVQKNKERDEALIKSDGEGVVKDTKDEYEEDDKGDGEGDGTGKSEDENHEKAIKELRESVQSLSDSLSNLSERVGKLEKEDLEDEGEEEGDEKNVKGKVAGKKIQVAKQEKEFDFNIPKKELEGYSTYY